MKVSESPNGTSSSRRFAIRQDSAARLDVLRAEVELANARARLIRARSSAEVSYQAVRTALSLPPQRAAAAVRLARRPADACRRAADLEDSSRRTTRTSARSDSSVRPPSGSCRSRTPS